ncbi:lytic polysaccharide monooxygenase auxiliary activity family 9 protein [Crossiella sp. CA198]|uniref:lytic polysaccharide monooxygenase auxiliary activity family 9 protein n=1 Tax=Crossiella sp. CA198 TaxID=3455607 RepID=UPI003F8D5670
MTRTPRRGLVLLALLPMLLTLFGALPASAHGTMLSPVSRAYQCRWHENPENPTSAACKAAVATGGTQAFYDWHEVNLANAAGNHRFLIPNGKLCSAGRDKYRGLDLTRSDWATTQLTAGAAVTWQYRAAVPHRGQFELYVTRNGYNPASPLQWSDLERFHTQADPPLVNGSYQLNPKLPAGKSGRHLIYSIWQRSDSPEAFYTCSDVNFR